MCYWEENISKQIEIIPHLLTVLLSIPLNKLPWMTSLCPWKHAWWRAVHPTVLHCSISAVAHNGAKTVLKSNVSIWIFKSLFIHGVPLLSTHVWQHFSNFSDDKLKKDQVYNKNQNWKTWLGPPWYLLKLKNWGIFSHA